MEKNFPCAQRHFCLDSKPSDAAHVALRPHALLHLEKSLLSQAPF